MPSVDPYTKLWNNRPEVKEIEKSLEENKQKLEDMTSSNTANRKARKATHGSILISKHLPWMNKGKYSD